MKKKHVCILAGSGIIIIGIGTYLYLDNPEDLLIIKDEAASQIVELGNEISTNPLDYLDTINLSDQQIEDIKENAVLAITPESGEMDEYKKVGIYDVNITYRSEEETVQVEIQDTTKPTINGEDDLTFEYGCNLDEYDFAAKYNVDDCSEVSVNYDYSGVDTDKAGEYQIVIEAKDTYDNSTTKLVKAEVESKVEEVVEEVPAVSPKSDASTSSQSQQLPSDDSTADNETTTTKDNQTDQGSSEEPSQSSESDDSQNSSDIEFKKTGEGDLDIGGTWESYDIVGELPEEWGY